MKINHYQIDPKASPTAQSLVQGEIDALVSFWQDIRDDDLIGPDVAFDLLATWAHLRRFDSNTLDEGLVTRLNTLVSSDLGLVCERTLDFPFPTNWPDEASRLDDEWDYVVDDDQIDKLEHAIREHFELLDRGSLVAYAISTLGSPHCEDERYKLFLKSLLRAENYLADDPSVLLPAAVYASSMLDSYRHDLYDVDEMLWDTTIKHRCLQELIDEQENQNRPTVLPTETVRILIQEDFTFVPPLSTGDQGNAFSISRKAECDDRFTDSWKIPTNSRPAFPLTNKARFANQHKSQTVNAAAGEAESVFLHIIYKIEGDPLVRARLDERQNAVGKLELVIALLGETSEAQKYTSVEIEFENAPLNRNAKFVLEDAIIQLSDDEAKTNIRSIILTDISNNQWRVIEE